MTYKIENFLRTTPPLEHMDSSVEFYKENPDELKSFIESNDETIPSNEVLLKRAKIIHLKNYCSLIEEYITHLNESEKG